ncbi:hypothetical protein OROGR_013526 [Orobanche gracilis]
MKINEKITDGINLAKFRKEVDSSFLGLAIDPSSYYNEDYDHHHHGKIIPLQSSYYGRDDCTDQSCTQDSVNYSGHHPGFGYDDRSVNYSRDEHQVINLAKFRKEVDSSFLRLAVNPSSNYNKDDRHHGKIIPHRSYHLASGCVDQSCSKDSRKYFDHRVINLAKFRKEVDSSFLGLAINPSSNYKTLNQDSDRHACFQDSDYTTKSLENLIYENSSIPTIVDCQGRLCALCR